MCLLTLESLDKKAFRLTLGVTDHQDVTTGHTIMVWKTEHVHLDQSDEQLTLFRPALQELSRCLPWLEVLGLKPVEGNFFQARVIDFSHGINRCNSPLCRHAFPVPKFMLRLNLYL